MFELLLLFTCRRIGYDISCTCTKLEQLTECKSSGPMLKGCLWRKVSVIVSDYNKDIRKEEEPHSLPICCLFVVVVRRL